MLNIFPRSPIKGTTKLIPITSWLELRRERKKTRVEYDLFWDDSVHEGVAYFFCWLGRPRATVLAIWEGKDLTHIEGRKVGDIPLSRTETRQVTAEVVRAFTQAGFRYRASNAN